MSETRNIVLAEGFTAAFGDEHLTGSLQYVRPGFHSAGELILRTEQGRAVTLSTHKVGDYSAKDVCGYRQLLITITPGSEQLIADLINRELVRPIVARSDLHGIEVAIVTFYHEVVLPPHDDDDDETEGEDD